MSRIKDQDRALHERLRSANERNLLLIYIDPKVVGVAHSPVFNPWESVAPLLLLLLLGLFMLLVGGMIVGTVALIAAVLLHVFVVRAWAEAQLRQRVIVHLMHSAAQMDRIWAVGGVILAMAHQPTVGVAAPKGNWRAFVTRHIPAPPRRDPLADELKNADSDLIPGRRDSDH